MKTLKTVIVEDEFSSQNLLLNMISDHCPSVEVVDVYDQVNMAIEGINSLKPDVIFLDIKLGNQSGYDILDQISHDNYHLIVTSGYIDYSVISYEYDADYFIMKPYSPKDVVKSISKVKNKVKEYSKTKDLNCTPEGLQSRVQLTNSDGTYYVNSLDIMWVEANGSYSTVHLVSGKKLITSNNLKEVASIINHPNIIRCHRSYLVNLNYLLKIEKKGGIELILTNEVRIKVSRNRRNAVLDLL